MNNTIALCIPAYNAERFLPQLLNSAKNQTIPFDEILVYNDCSKDDTERVAIDFGAEVVNGDVNRGCSYGKNKLAEIAKSEWLHFHDADDELYPNFVEISHKWIKKPDCPDVVLFPYEEKDYETKKLLNVRRFNDVELVNDPIKYSIINQINPFCGLYKKEKFLSAGGYDLDPLVLYNEDVAMHCQLARKGLKFRAEEEKITIINYRVSTSMSTRNQLECIRAHYHVLRKSAENVDSKYFTIISNELRITAGILASFLDWKTADKAMNLALKLDGKKDLYGSKSFKFLSKVNPYLALRIREYSIRLFKPHLRKQ